VWLLLALIYFGVTKISGGGQSFFGYLFSKFGLYSYIVSLIVVVSAFAYILHKAYRSYKENKDLGLNPM
jgi:hypothetical protein